MHLTKSYKLFFYFELYTWVNKLLIFRLEGAENDVLIALNLQVTSFIIWSLCYEFRINHFSRKYVLKYQIELTASRKCWKLQKIISEVIQFRIEDTRKQKIRKVKRQKNHVLTFTRLVGKRNGIWHTIVNGIPMDQNRKHTKHTYVHTHKSVYVCAASSQKYKQ